MGSKSRENNEYKRYIANNPKHTKIMPKEYEYMSMLDELGCPHF